MTQLDEALLSGPDAVLAYYQPTVQQIARAHCTQERPTLNEADMQQLGLFVVNRCYLSMQRTHIRQFDFLVKSSIKRRLLSEIGKEFCESRGRFAIDNFTEVMESEDQATTPVKAKTAYAQYHENLTNNTTYERLCDDILTLLPKRCHPIAKLLITSEDLMQKRGGLKKLAKMANLPLSKVEDLVDEIHTILSGYRAELFHHKYRSI